VPQRGVVSLRAPGRTPISVRVGPNGRFRFYAPAGSYQLTGRTPQFAIDGHEGRCQALGPAHVRRHRTTHVDVYCQRS
jgi:hypothetical protein